MATGGRNTSAEIENTLSRSGCRGFGSDLRSEDLRAQMVGARVAEKARRKPGTPDPTDPRGSRIPSFRSDRELSVETERAQPHGNVTRQVPGLENRLPRILGGDREISTSLFFVFWALGYGLWDAHSVSAFYGFGWLAQESVSGSGRVPFYTGKSW